MYFSSTEFLIDVPMLFFLVAFSSMAKYTTKFSLLHQLKKIAGLIWEKPLFLHFSAVRDIFIKSVFMRDDIGSNFHVANLQLQFLTFY